MIRTVAPAQPIVLLSEAKAQFREVANFEDWLIQGHIDAAEAYLDGFDGVLGRCVMPQTWRASADEVACGIRPHDVIETTENEDGTVDYVCGMPAHKVPIVRLAMLQILAHWFDHRDAVTELRLMEMPMGARALLASVRVWA